jgi:hypothetical protein
MEGSASPQSLRAEHDVLAARLAVRRSVDQGHRALVRLFLGVLCGGAAGALLAAGLRATTADAPASRAVPVAAALLITGATVLGALSVVAWIRRCRLARQEAALFSRLRELRRQLEVDP